MAKKKTLQEAVSKEIKSKFDLNSFKQKKGLKQNVKFKDQEWIPLSKAFQDVTSVPGIPMGHIVLLRGHSDTGKTTALLEAAVAAQKRQIMPVFIITEMKWSWDHAKMMGMEVNEVVDKETGEVVDYDGNFIYVDRETIHTIEDVAVFILDLIDEQKKGNLPYDLLFLWDSIGSVTTTNGMQVQCPPNLEIMLTKELHYLERNPQSILIHWFALIRYGPPKQNLQWVNLN